MFKTILVQLTGQPSDNSALETAYLVARLFDAHIDGLHVSPAWSQIAMSVAAQNLDGAMSAQDIFAAYEQEGKNLAWRAKRHFEEFRRRWNVAAAETPPGPHGVSAAWREVKGDVAEKNLAEARFYDLVVVGRGSEIADLSAEIMNAGRPILLAPKQAPENLAPTIAIAWKDTAEAARAVMAAMPLLMKADKVLILAAEESGGSTASLESAKRLVQQMRWHGISAEAHHVSPAGRSVADAIAHIAQERKADILVMGAYGHSRFRELVLGGVTRDVLRECRLPVLLFH